MRFLKLELTWVTSPWLIVLSAEARLSWIMLLCYAKASGLNGRVKRIDAFTASRLWFVGEESVRQMELAAANDGALIAEDGDWVITNWRKYQSDETAAERMRRHRESKMGDSVTDVTRNARIVTEKRREEKRRELPPKSPKGEISLADFVTAEFPSLVSHLPAIDEWIAYKKERKQSYKPMGLKAFLKGLEKHSNPSSAIARCMANNWSGVHPDGANGAPPRKPVAMAATDEQLQRVSR